jgi:hypothetical protein
MAFCPKCGSRLNEGAAFCTSCGTATTASAGATARPAPPPRPATPPVYQSYAPAGGATAPSLMTRVTNILTKPKEEWPVIAGETATVGGLFTGYIVILSAIPAIANFISMAFIGSVISSVFRLPLSFTLGSAILTYVLSLGGIYLAAFIVEKLAPSFQSQGTTVDALKLVAYSYTAAWVAGICGLLPIIGLLGVLAGGIYSIYLFYLGLPGIMKTPQDKVIIYMIASAVVIMVIYFVVSMIVGGIATALFMSRAVTPF